MHASLERWIVLSAFPARIDPVGCATAFFEVMYVFRPTSSPHSLLTGDHVNHPQRIKWHKPVHLKTMWDVQRQESTINPATQSTANLLKCWMTFNNLVLKKIQQAGSGICFSWRGSTNRITSSWAHCAVALWHFHDEENDERPMSLKSLPQECIEATACPRARSKELQGVKIWNETILGAETVPMFQEKTSTLNWLHKKCKCAWRLKDKTKMKVWNCNREQKKTVINQPFCGGGFSRIRD